MALIWLPENPEGCTLASQAPDTMPLRVGKRGGGRAVVARYNRVSSHCVAGVAVGSVLMGAGLIRLDAVTGLEALAMAFAKSPFDHRLQLSARLARHWKEVEVRIPPKGDPLGVLRVDLTPLSLEEAIPLLAFTEDAARWAAHYHRDH